MHRFKTIHRRVLHSLWLCTLTFYFHHPVQKHTLPHPHTATHCHTHTPWSYMTTCQPHPVCFFIHPLFWPANRPLASRASQTTLTVPPHTVPSVSSFLWARNPTSQAQCGFTYCHNDTSHCPTCTLREWVINKPGSHLQTVSQIQDSAMLSVLRPSPSTPFLPSSPLIPI